MTHRMPSKLSKLRPDRKVAYAAGIGIPAGTIIAWVVESGLHVDVPATVATAFGGLVTGLWAYFTRDAA